VTDLVDRKESNSRSALDRKFPHQMNMSQISDAIKKKAGAPKKSVVTAKECIPKNENMKESVPSWAVSIHDSSKSRNQETQTLSFPSACQHAVDIH
jgi:hypothetical protein